MSNIDMIDVLLEECADDLTEWEHDFLENLKSLDDVEEISSERQRKLDEIWEKKGR